jgi:hypothetical protein
MKRSPWGKVQLEHKIREGMTSVTTAGHGGIKLSRTLNSKIPIVFRCKGGWYEEDQEWAIVALFFPEDFPGRTEHALTIIKNHWPDEYMLWFGKTLALEESHELRRQHFRAVNASNFVVRAAWGDWHPQVPAGYVGVFARKFDPEEESYFLIQADDYGDADKPFGFVIDLERHAHWGGPNGKSTTKEL